MMAAFSRLAALMRLGERPQPARVPPLCSRGLLLVRSSDFPKGVRRVANSLDAVRELQVEIVKAAMVEPAAKAG
jgi:hypothetical protein